MLQFHEDTTSNHKVSSVDHLLPLDDECDNHQDISNSDEVEEEIEEDPALVRTKHDLVTSPWSRLGIIGGAFGAAFLVIFVVLNGMMNGDKTAKKPEITPTPTTTATPVEKKDGDVYAKLALAKQQEELDALNGKKNKEEEKPQARELPPEKSTAKDNPTQNAVIPEKAPKRVVVPQETEQPRQHLEPAIAISPRRSQVVFQPIQPERSQPVSYRRVASAISPQSTPNSGALDPLAELERLRNLGNVGRVQYVSIKNTEVTPTTGSSTTERTIVAQDDTSTSRPRRRRNSSLNQESTNNGNNTSTPVEELRPRWQPISQSEDKGQQVTSNYLSEESQILEEKKAQYLVVGSFARATLVTPLVLPQTRQPQHKEQCFVAQLDEPIYSNTGEVALEKGTLLALTITSIDGSSSINAEVTAIIKDETEYPVSPGTISILGKDNSPLIARPYKNKGAEIARYDTTLGAIAGIAKVGEIINRPDEQVTQSLPLGGVITQSSNNKRNLGSAFLEGTFGKLSETIGKRTERATDEIVNRPVVWYVPKNTKITVKVDRSLKL
ncbi:MAG: TrbI/VirB10 family protein [Rhizonema sp. PD38]|nr:TrbI/VirB10 family protein [Rhizonema sp. PD38]